MITKLSHTSIWVLDQEIAFDFYVNKLGMKVKTDVTMENGFRWLTLNAPNQPDLEFVLMKLEVGPILNEEQVEATKKLVAAGATATGVFNCDNCRETYKELVAKGVQFKGEPEEQFYGIEAILIDPFGNWFSMTEPKAF